MKKRRLFDIVCMVICSSMVSAQVKVASNGRVGIGTEPQTDAKMAVEVSGQYESAVAGYITSYNDWGPAVFGKAYYGTNRQIGTWGEAKTATPCSSGRAYGVLGVAGQALK